MHITIYDRPRQSFKTACVVQTIHLEFLLEKRLSNHQNWNLLGLFCSTNQLIN